MLNVKVKDERARENLRRTATVMPQEVVDGVSRATLHLQAEVVRLLSNVVLKRRSGNYARSINSRVEQVGNEMKGYVGTNAVYGPPHEFGATIKPVRAKFLAIPKKDALTGTGVARFTPRQRPDMFIYVKSVTIPERSHFRRGLAEQQAKINEYIDQGVKRALARGQGAHHS